MSSSPSRSGALVIVTGLPASGKSLLLAWLAQRTGLVALSKDEFKERLFERHGTGDAAHSRRLSDAAFAALFEQAAAGVATQGALLVEGNFRAGEHEAALLAACGAPPPAFAQVLCRLDESQRRARLAARAAGSGRHPGHRDHEALAALRRGAAAGPGSVVDRFLELPGPRVVYDSGLAPPPEAFEAVYAALVPWLAVHAPGGPARANGG